MAFQYTFRGFDIPSWESAAQDLVQNRDLELELYTTTIDTSLALKANIASPTFTGVPLAPTATTGTNTTQLATTSFVQAMVTAAGTFVSYTPALSGWTLGNGTLTGRYCQIGKLVTFEMKLTIGSTSNTAGIGPIITMPLADVTNGMSQFSFKGTAYDVSTATNYNMSAWNVAANVGQFPGNFYPVTDVANSTFDYTYYTLSNQPMTWATGDILYMSGTYEAG